MPYVVQLYIKLSPHILYTLTFCGVHTWHTWHFHILWLYIHLKGIPVAPTSIALFYIHWPLLYTYKAPLAPTQVSDTGRGIIQSIKEDEIYIPFYGKIKIGLKNWQSWSGTTNWENLQGKISGIKSWKTFKKYPEQ